MSKTAKIGDNNPPEPTPFEVSQGVILDLYQQAQDYLDGEPITTQGHAGDVQALMRLIQAEQKTADERRKEEARPFDDGKAEVQARYNPLIQKDKGKCDLAINTCKKALTPWLEKLEAQRQKEAAEARRIAEEKQRLAEEENLKALASADLRAREEADRKLKEAAEANKAATKLEKTTIKAVGVGRAASLRTSYRAEITDVNEAIRHYWKTDRQAFTDLVQSLATAEVNRGVRAIPGVNVIEERIVA